MIGVYFDPQGTTVERKQQAPGSATAWILVHLGGDAAAAGASGAEFRLADFPETWAANAVASSAAITVAGNPLGGGASLVFGSCQTVGPAGAPVLLYTVYYLATAVVDHHVMSIGAHTSPSNPAFECPCLVLCDAPASTRICVSGSRAAFNYPGFNLAVERSSWSAVKALYE
jgi:hypothetical protein